MELGKVEVVEQKNHLDHILFLYFRIVEQWKYSENVMEMLLYLWS